MTEELLVGLIEYAGDDYDPEQQDLLLLLIDDAIEEVVNEMCPYGFSSDSEEETMKQLAVKRYKSKIRRIAQYHYDKQGIEGVTSFSGNGESRTYSDSGTPKDYLRGIIPVAKLV